MAEGGALPTKGKTYFAGSNRTIPTTYGWTTKLEGTPKNFVDRDPAATTTAAQLRSGRTKKCLFVRNTSGTTLYAKRIVSWESGYEGRRVDGFTTTNWQAAAGVVDEELPSSGVQDNDFFWLEVSGPCLVTMPTTAVAGVAVGDTLGALTAATSQGAAAGRIAVWNSALTASSAGVTEGLRIINRIGRALSAKTTNQTGVDVLANLEIVEQINQ